MYGVVYSFLVILAIFCLHQIRGMKISSGLICDYILGFIILTLIFDSWTFYMLGDFNKVIGCVLLLLAYIPVIILVKR